MDNNRFRHRYRVSQLDRIQERKYFLWARNPGYKANLFPYSQKRGQQAKWTTTKLQLHVRVAWRWYWEVSVFQGETFRWYTCKVVSSVNVRSWKLQTRKEEQIRERKESLSSREMMPRPEESEKFDKKGIHSLKWAYLDFLSERNEEKTSRLAPGK